MLAFIGSPAVTSEMGLWLRLALNLLHSAAIVRSGAELDIASGLSGYSEHYLGVGFALSGVDAELRY